MGERRWNILLVLFSLGGGLLGFILGELLIQLYSDVLPSIVLVGLYFGIIALCIGLMCLLAELISPRLNGISWRRRYAGTSWKMLVPATLALLFVGGLVLEWLYELDLGKLKPPSEIVMAIDVSGSMQQTDPNQERFTAAKNLVQLLDNKKSAAVIGFNESAFVVQPLIALDSQTVKNDVLQMIDSIEQTEGATDIAAALQAAMQELEASPSREGALVILLSDGFSDVDLPTALAPYLQKQIAIHTIGMNVGDQSGNRLLADIAAETGGTYYDVTEATELSGIFSRIYLENTDRTLISERSGVLADSKLYAILRILAFVVIGVCIGLSLGLVFDNRFLAASFSFGGILSGLIAGLIMEYGLANQPEHDTLYRLFAILALALVISLFTWAVPIKDKGSRLKRSSGDRSADAGESFGRRRGSDVSKGF